MFASMTLASRPLATAPRKPRPFAVQAVAGQYGWAAWSFSRQAKLNAWSWHGIGDTAINSWAALGNSLYFRKEIDSLVHVMQPDVFLAADAANSESSRVEATTQWLDFGKPGKMKALTGLDCDVLGIDTLEVYTYIPDPANPRSRVGSLAASIPLSDAASGWTYNGEIIPMEEVGAATEFQIRFVATANQEAAVNRLTLYWDDVSG